MTRSILALTATALLVSAQGLAAQSVESGAVITGPNGLTTEVQRQITGGAGNQKGAVSVQRENGRGWTRNWTRTRQNGTVIRQGTLTTNNGRTWIRDSQRGCANGACSGRSVVTGPGGGTWTTDRSWTRTGKGQWEGQVTRTGPKGRTTTSRRWFQIRRK